MYHFHLLFSLNELIKWRQWLNNDDDDEGDDCEDKNEQTFNYHYIHQRHVLFWALIYYNDASRTQETE